MPRAVAQGHELVAEERQNGAEDHEEGQTDEEETNKRLRLRRGLLSLDEGVVHLDADRGLGADRRTLPVREQREGRRRLPGIAQVDVDFEVERIGSRSFADVRKVGQRTKIAVNMGRVL